MSNFNFDNLPLENWVLATKGDISAINEKGVLNSDTIDAWFGIQDDYVELMGGDSVELKQYKRLCYDYYIALCEWFKNPRDKGKEYTEVNYLFSKKKEMLLALTSKDGKTIEELIAMVSIAVKFQIDKKKMTAKEFFLIFKELQNGNATD